MKVRCSALVRRDDQILFLKYNYPKGIVYALPGGGQKKGETLIEALEREYNEELGVSIKTGPLLYIGDMHAGDQFKQRVHIVFLAEITHGTPTINPDQTSADSVQWISVSHLAEKKLYPAISKHIISDWNQLGQNARYLGNCLQREWM